MDVLIFVFKPDKSGCDCDCLGKDFDSKLGEDQIEDDAEKDNAGNDT